MTRLVDANVLSEPTKPLPDAKVVAWLRRHEAELVVDPIILGEIRFGIYLLPAGKRRRRLELWFQQGVAKLTLSAVDAGNRSALGETSGGLALRRQGDGHQGQHDSGHGPRP